MIQDLRSAPSAAIATEIVASRICQPILLDAGHPAPEWQRAAAQTFCADWQGNNGEAGHETQVRVLWSEDAVYVRFKSHYRELNLFPDAVPGTRRDRLWERDVAEVFLQSDPSRPNSYCEFEVSPNGMWLDLSISRAGRADLKSYMQSSVFLDEKARTWAAELAIPMRSLTPAFDHQSPWKANFFRVEGRQEPRRYMCWRPTHSHKPDFHVPGAFGLLRFAEDL